MRVRLHLAIGAVAGLLSAASVFIPLPDAPAPRLFGYCFGIDVPAPRCGGLPASFYLFPGLIFGAVFAGVETRSGRFDARRAIALIAAAGIGNALATMLCVGLFLPLGTLINMEGSNIPLALAGAVAGTVGGACLSGTTRLVCGGRVRRSIAAAALLGLLVPMAPQWVAGTFAFYVLWQAGYAAALWADMSGA